MDLLYAVKSKYTPEHQPEDFDNLENAQPPEETESDRDMQVFFQKVEEVKGDMNEIKALQREIHQMHEKGKQLVKSKEIQAHQEELQDRIAQVNTIAHKVKSKVEALDKLNEQAVQKKGQGLNSVSERTRTTITAGLKKKLKDLMGEFSQLRNRMQEDYREVVGRRVYTVTGKNVPEEEIERIIESGKAESIFQEALLDAGRGRVLDTLAEIQERHRAIKDLEQSLLELHQIFLDMAVLVEAQGEMLDNIEKQVARSVDFVKTGTKDLQTAKQLQKSRRKWMCCGLVVVLIVIAVIVIVIVRPWNMLK